MAEKEGVIKFQMDFAPAPPVNAAEVTELNAWRKLLVLLKVLGQDDARYAGYGFGNISRALSHAGTATQTRSFLITGTQTGAISDLLPEHLVVVDGCFPEENRIVAHGPLPPSSEAMTHGGLYALSPEIQWVMHGHSPVIWHAAASLCLPTTDPAIPYGTPEMSYEMNRLWRASDLRERHILSMGGHEDGIVTFGSTAQEAFQPWIDSLVAIFTARQPT